MFTSAKCGHCGKTGSKLQTIEPTQAAYKLNAVCCIHCNAILGVTEFMNSGQLLAKAEKEREAMSKKIDQLSWKIDQMANALRR